MKEKVIKMKERSKVWLDCDPGHDDAMAILLAGYSPDQVELIGISTVHGNQSVAKTTTNALACLEAFGLSNVTCVKGQGQPLCREAKHCAEIHGESGLDDLQGNPLFPHTERIKPVEGKCVNVMQKAFLDHYEEGNSGNKIKLVATGALTNVAILLTVYPELKDTIEVIFMGGAYGLGNTGPVSEFNMQIDPEAAKVVFNSGAKVTMIPLEVTHTALATKEVVASIRQDGKSKLRNALCELLYFFKDSYKSYFGFDDPPLHDPCAVAYVIDPKLFEVEHIRVDVETGSELCAGQTVCDRHNLKGKERNAHVAYAMKVDAFWDLILKAIDRAEEQMKDTRS